MSMASEAFRACVASYWILSEASLAAFSDSALFSSKWELGLQIREARVTALGSWNLHM